MLTWQLHLPRAIALPRQELEGLTFGRADACDVRLDSLKLLTMVSRRHCRFTRKRAAADDAAASGAAAWHLEDLASTNGTVVNDQRLRPHKRVRVGEGDVITFGSGSASEVKYRLSLRSSDATDEPS